MSRVLIRGIGEARNQSTDRLPPTDAQSTSYPAGEQRA